MTGILKSILRVLRWRTCLEGDLVPLIRRIEQKLHKIVHPSFAYTTLRLLTHTTRLTPWPIPEVFISKKCMVSLFILKVLSQVLTIILSCHVIMYITQLYFSFYKKESPSVKRLLWNKTFELHKTCINTIISYLALYFKLKMIQLPCKSFFFFRREFLCLVMLVKES